MRAARRGAAAIARRGAAAIAVWPLRGGVTRCGRRRLLTCGGRGFHTPWKLPATPPQHAVGAVEDARCLHSITPWRLRPLYADRSRSVGAASTPWEPRPAGVASTASRAPGSRRRAEPRARGGRPPAADPPLACPSVGDGAQDHEKIRTREAIESLQLIFGNE